MAERCKRCSIEHRTIRKELAKWHKNVALLAGMERVAQELMGGRKWRKLMIPFNCLEQTTPEDWSQLETCYFCNSKSQTPYDSTKSVVPPCDQLLDEKTSDDTNIGDKCSQCNGQSGNGCQCSTKSCPSPSHPTDQPLDLSIHSRHKRSAIASTHSECSEKSDKENPLIKVPLPSSTAKAIKRNRLPNSTWKRTYTEEELSAALRDIQSGKLGTRRAAVIYGIPRSTLRNKVYKMALDRSNNGKRRIAPSAANSSTTASHYKKSKSSLLNNNTNIKPTKNANSTLSHMLDNSSTSASESLKQILKNTITQRANVNTNGADTHSTKSIDGSAAALAALGLANQPGANSLTDIYNNEALATLQMLSALSGDQSLSPLAPLFSQLLLAQAMALAQAKRPDEDDAAANVAASLPLLPELLRKLTESQMPVTSGRSSHSSQSSNHSNQSNGDKCESQPELSGNSNSNVILKVPSYKPKTSSAAVKQSAEEQPNVTTSDTEAVNMLCTTSSQLESENISDFESKSFSLKDIIAKSISQRLKNSTNASKSSLVVHSEESSCDAIVSDDLKNSGNVSDHSNPSTPEKRNRPKRGRYRNYNRDDLAKAVKAVQRGEMSVHRAGTLFGVPHSTLEYKVKERHLLRPKKRLNETTNSTKKDSPINKSNGTSVANRAVNGSADTSEAKNSAANLPLWQTAFNFMPNEVNTSGNSHNNFFASNMMRKLQENARLNEEGGTPAKTQADPSADYGGLLLESLIKSSLIKNTLNDDNNNTKSQSDDDDEEEDNDNDDKEDDDKQVVNTSLELLKEVSALGKKD